MSNEQVITIDYTNLDDAYQQIVALLVDAGMDDRKARESARLLLAGVKEEP